MIGVTWSDNFKPNSMSKVNRGSVWIKNLILYSKDSFSIFENTYPISISLKTNYYYIERKFIEELEELIINKENIFFKRIEQKYLRLF